jgi:two-component system phosphate regulon sensor histidine kinase PhoR
MQPPGKNSPALDLHASHTLVLVALWACPVVLIAGAVMGWPLPWLAGVCFVVALAGAWTLRASIWKPMAQLQQQAARATRQLAQASSEASGDVLRAATAARARLDSLERDRAGLLAIFDAVQSPLLVVDAQGQAIAANAACIAFFAQRSGVVGRHLDELFTQPAVLRLHARAVAGEVASQTITLSRDGGPRVFMVVAAPTAPRLSEVPSLITSSVVISLRDITDLAQASALKAAFVANASHELRTPLSSIRVAIDTLSDGAWDDQAMRSRLAEVISDNTQRLDEMVRDLMELSRLESPDLQVSRERVRLLDIYAEIERQFVPIAQERGLSLRCEASGGGPGALVLRTDRRLLLLIVRNLVDNALKFAKEGTTVRVLAQVVVPPGGTLRAAPRGTLRLRVIDEGLGIPVEHQQRIFERFYQVDSARTGGSTRRGTGLGLAIVKHAVKDLGGTIRVESVWKQGTTMIVEVPGVVEGGSVEARLVEGGTVEGGVVEAEE